MRTISADFKSRLYDDNYRKYLRTIYITLSDGTSLTLDNTNLMGRGLVIEEATSSENSLDIGSAIINECQVVIANLSGAFSDYVFEGAKVIPYVGLTLANDTVENIKLGEYEVASASRTGIMITLTCYDAMQKFDQPISKSNLSYPASLNSIIADACSVCGVPLATNSIPHGSYTVAQKPEEGATTFRNLLSWAGQISGTNATINVNGQLEFFWYDTTKLHAILNGQEPSGIHIFTSSYSSITLAVSDITVTQVNVSEEVEDSDGNRSIARYTFGNTGYTLSVEDNKLVQAGHGEEIAQWLYNDLNGFRYRKASLSVQSDPSIQAGDIAKIYDTRGNYYAIIISETTFEPGVPQQIKSSGAEATQTSITRSSIQTQNYVGLMVSLNEERASRKEVERNLVERIDANYAEIQFLRTDVAQIGVLQADYASFKDATAQNFSAVNADIQNIRTQDLTAINANIGTLQGDFANISSILAGNVGTGQLQTITLTAQNTTVATNFADKIMANYAIVQRLIAGNINTDNVTISSTDGSLNISGSVQQFKDDNGTVRIQIGKDAQDNYSFSIYDAQGNPVWYNDGITAEGIPSGILVDSMVAPASGSYQGISANKLNISEVRGAIETGGFSSSLIYFDSDGQSLNQKYTQMTSDIEDASDIATRAKQSADSTASQVASIREFISGIDTLEGMMLLLTNDAHVVHTYNDGTGGDYTDANTRVIVMVGETDVTTQAILEYEASPSVTGTWNSTSKTYQVTGLSDMDGYVDFYATYGAVVRYLTTRSGNQFLTRSGAKLKLPSGAAHLSKRFSISKSPDGAVGTSYDVHASVLAITRDANDHLSPSSVTFSAVRNSGIETADYSGYFVIEETTDNETYAVKYTSSTAESSKTYIPSSSAVRNIRCTLYNSVPNGNVLDIQNVVIIADADGMQTDIATAKQSIQTLSTRVGTVETGIDGLRVDLSATQTELHGVSDGSLLFQTPFSWSEDRQTASFRAVVYRVGQDVTEGYPAKWFKWLLRTEDGEDIFAIGKTATVRKSQLGYGGTVIGQFSTYDIAYLTTRSGNKFTTRSGNYMTIYNNA